MDTDETERERKRARNNSNPKDNDETERPCQRGGDRNVRNALQQDENVELPVGPPEAHHQISWDVKNKINLPRFLKANEGDPSLCVRQRICLPHAHANTVFRILQTD